MTVPGEKAPVPRPPASPLSQEAIVDRALSRSTNPDLYAIAGGLGTSAQAVGTGLLTYLPDSPRAVAMGSVLSFGGLIGAMTAGVRADVLDFRFRNRDTLGLPRGRFLLNDPQSTPTELPHKKEPPQEQWWRKPLQTVSRVRDATHSLTTAVASGLAVDGATSIFEPGQPLVVRALSLGEIVAAPILGVTTGRVADELSSDDRAYRKAQRTWPIAPVVPIGPETDHQPAPETS